MHPTGRSLSLVLLVTCVACRPTPQPATTLTGDAARPIDAARSVDASPTPDASHAIAAAPAATGAKDRRDVYCEAYQGNARENCYLRLAFVSKDAALCEKAGSLHGECEVHVARATGDASRCLHTAEPRDVFDCFMAAALRTKSDASCAPLNDASGQKAACLRAGGTADRCNVWSAERAALAHRACVSVARADRAACVALPARADGSREACLSALALKTKDAALCAPLHDPRVTDDAMQLDERKCVADVVTAIAETKKCDGAVHGRRYPAGDVDFDVCLMAAARRDLAACDRMTPRNTKEQTATARRGCLAGRSVDCRDMGVSDCVMSMQMGMRDVELCREGADEGCALTVAFNTGDRNACAAIASPELQAACAELTKPH